jgi:hypothetical protein
MSNRILVESLFLALLLVVAVLGLRFWFFAVLVIYILTSVIMEALYHLDLRKLPRVKGQVVEVDDTYDRGSIVAIEFEYGNQVFRIYRDDSESSYGAPFTLRSSTYVRVDVVNPVDSVIEIDRTMQYFRSVCAIGVLILVYLFGRK